MDIKELRDSVFLTQQSFSRLCFDVPEEQISRWEKGEKIEPWVYKLLEYRIKGFIREIALGERDVPDYDDYEPQVLKFSNSVRYKGRHYRIKDKYVILSLFNVDFAKIRITDEILEIMLRIEDKYNVQCEALTQEMFYAILPKVQEYKSWEQ